MGRLAHDWTTVRRLLPYIWPNHTGLRTRVVLSLVLLVVSKVATVSIPLVYRAAVAALLATPPVLPTGAIIAYGVVKLTARVATDSRDATFVPVSQHALRAIGLETFNHLMSLSLGWHLRKSTGTATKALNRGTTAVERTLSYFLFSIFPIFLEVFFTMAVLLYLYEPAFATITTFVCIAYVAATLIITEWRNKFRRLMNEADNAASSRTVEALISYETVKVFGTESFEAQRLDVSLRKYMDAAIKTRWSLAVLNGAQAALISLGVVGVMLLSAKRVIEGKQKPEDFVVLTSYTLQLYIPLNYLGSSYRAIKSGLVDVENMFSLLDEPLDITDVDAPLALPTPIAGRVAFNNVVFSYPEREGSSDSHNNQDDDDGGNDNSEEDGGTGTSGRASGPRRVLDGVSFEVPPGHKVALVGPSGAGKSTVARLLFRFFDVTSGSITLDGIDISQVDQTVLRRQIGVIPQDTVLFNDTIRYNIRYARPGASHQDVVRAAQAASIHRFILSLPDGYDTRVGERGLRLSGGEKQRVAIARALLADPPLLICDESTSALDTPTERQVAASLAFASEGRSSLHIAHRLSTISDANEILVLSQGNIVERGTHSQLVALGGMYADMWEQQQRGDEDEASDGGGDGGGDGLTA